MIGYVQTSHLVVLHRNSEEHDHTPLSLSLATRETFIGMKTTLSERFYLPQDTSMSSKLFNYLDFMLYIIISHDSRKSKH